MLTDFMEQETTPLKSSGARVLAIEDDDILRPLIVERLRAVGYEPASARNGQEGIRMAGEWRPDLILCDVMMPGLDGYGVLEALRRDEKVSEIPVIFLTALAGREDFRKGMELGADDYLTKPFNGTDLVRAIETRLKKAASLRKRAEGQIDQSLGQMAALVHDLRNPVCGLLHYSQSLASGEAQGDPKKWQLVNASLDRIDTLLEEMLLFTRSRFRKLPFHPVSVDVRSVVERVIAAQAGSDRVRCEFPPDLVRVEADPVQVQHIVSNLVDNALKYGTPGRPVMLSVALEGGRMRLEVTNEGASIPLTEAAHLFGAFFRREATSHIPGYGLGLSLVKSCVDQHGGTVLLVQDQPGRVTFRVELPEHGKEVGVGGESGGGKVRSVEPEAVSDWVNPGVPGEEEMGGGRQVTGKVDTATKILVLDDDELVRDAVVGMIRQQAPEAVVMEASDLARARALLKAHRFEVAFLDLHLPDGMSFELVPLIPEDTQFVFASAYDEYAVQAVQYQPLAYHIKPLQAAQVKGVLDRCLSIRKKDGGAGLKAFETRKLSLPFSTGTAVVRVSEIQMIKAYGEYSTVILVDGRTCIIRQSLNAWEKQLEAPFFVRAHRNTIINVSLVESIVRLANRRLQIRIVGVTQPVEVSSRMTTKVKKVIKAFLEGTVNAAGAKRKGRKPIGVELE